MTGSLISRRLASTGKTLPVNPGEPATPNHCNTPQGPWILFLRRYFPWAMEHTKERCRSGLRHQTLTP